MKEFIHGHLFFAKFDKVEDVELNDREAYTEYKVKKRNWDGPISLEFFTSSLKLNSFFKFRVTLDTKGFRDHLIRLRDLQRFDIQNHYRRIAMERAALDYSLLSSQHKIYPRILQFDREWKTVLMKNLQKLPSKYSVSRTFGIGPEDFRKKF